jgi:Fe-S cluster assembly ATP-binding protein
MFLAFQYPIEIQGISNATFLKTAINEIRKYNGLEELTPKEFLERIKEKAKILGLDESLISRSVNVGFSGGEKKRNEVFQMLMLEPKFVLLDETDSGLDIDALKIVSNGVNIYRNKDNAVLVVTHYQRLLDYIQPDYVHVLYKGRIIKTGGKELALELEAKGYDWVKDPEFETQNV